MAAPTVTDLKSFLTKRCGAASDSVVATDDPTLTKALNYALKRVDKVTGYNPFIVGAAADKSVEISGKTGRFSNGATGTVSVSLDGTVYADGTDYRLYPLNSPTKEYMVWLRTYGPTKPLTVNAAWGYGTDYPDDLWEAIVMLAAALSLVAFTTGQAGILGSSWTDGDVAQALAVQSSAGQVSENGIASVSPGILAAEALIVYGNYKRPVAWG